MAKVLMALSGGVDSAVSASLLQKQGHEVEAAFMKNWSQTAGLRYDECPWLEDRRSALRVAAFLGIKLHTLDFEKEYSKSVMDYFFKEYKAGRTPNPDVMCNKEIKFKLLYDWAMKHGFDYLATGHYEQVKKNSPHESPLTSNRKKVPTSKTQDYTLARSIDEFKDQTYFIYNIKTQQLPHLLFPIGHLKKSAVKQLAKKLGLPNAGREESMGLCFVGKIRLKDFLEQKLKPKRGPIINTQGEKIGEHEGLYYYTIGQRQGIKIGGSAGPFYVVKKDLKNNTLTVTNNPEDKLLFVKEIQIHSVNWISKPEKLDKLTGRFRHQGELISLKVSELGKGIFKVVFTKPQKAIASGQSLVLYRNKECIGGGVIV